MKNWQACNYAWYISAYISVVSSCFFEQNYARQPPNDNNVTVNIRTTIRPKVNAPFYNTQTDSCLSSANTCRLVMNIFYYFL